jgi:hypothetical protein
MRIVITVVKIIMPETVRIHNAIIARSMGTMLEIVLGMGGMLATLRDGAEVPIGGLGRLVLSRDGQAITVKID